MDKVTICNLAISECGGNLINAVPDGNKQEGLLCNLWYDTALDAVLAEHPWKFCRKWVGIASDAAYVMVDDQYAYAYRIPNDFIRFADQENRAVTFARRGSHFLCNELSPFELEYIFRETDPNRYPIWFISALAAMLAWKISPSLMRKGSKGVDYEARYLRTLAQAKEKDAKEDAESLDRKIRHTASNDSWIEDMG